MPYRAWEDVTVLDRAPPFAAATVTAPRPSSAALIPTRPARLASACRRCARTSCSGHVPAARTRGTRPAPSSSPTRSALRAAGSSRRRVFRPARVPSLGYATEDRAQTRTWVVGRASLTVTVRRLRRRAREPPPPRHAPPGFAIGGSSLMSAWIVVRNEEHGGGAETNNGTEAGHGAFHGRGRAAPGGDPCRVRLPRDQGWSGYLAGKNSTQGGDRGRRLW